MQEKISYLQAKEILNSQNIYPKSIERVFLHESLNRILSQDIFAPNDMPILNLSNMDGYAIYSAMLNSFYSILSTLPK